MILLNSDTDNLNEDSIVENEEDKVGSEVQVEADNLKQSGNQN